MKKIKNKSGVTYHTKKNSSKVNTNKTKSANNVKRKRKTKFKIDFKDKDFLTLLILGVITIVIAFITLGAIWALILALGIAIIIVVCNFMRRLRRKKAWRIVTNVLLVLMLLGCIAGSLGAVVFMYYVVKQAPDFDVKLLDRSETTLVYSADNQLVGELGTEKRENITYDELSQTFIDALIATEDSRFFQHNGFDAARFLKASLGQVAGQDAGGASTISMQVIKTNFTDAKVTKGLAGIVRKFTDIYLAVFKLERNYSKQQIIEFYVNINYMGDTAHGVEQAAQTYFGKTASELNLAEASILAGLYQSPYSLNPYKNPEGATERRSRVLDLMVMHGYITKEERDLADSIPVESLLIGKDSNEDYEYQWYIDTAVQEIIDRYGVNPYNTPMIIYTNMDVSKQKGIDNIFNGKTYTWRDDYMQAGIAVVDVDTGKIVAIGGGREKGQRLENKATSITRQIGSTAKPLFDYGPGMEYLNWSTFTMWEDKETNYSSGQPMRNSDREYWGWMTTRSAIAYSRNTPALQAFQQLDKKKIIDFVTKLGITPEIDQYGNIHEAHSIGSFNGSNPLQMAAAYAAFANGGTYYEPYAVNKVIFRDTGVEDTYKSEGVRAMSDSTAYMMTMCLRTAVTEGLSSAAGINGVQLAAKTGTTNYNEDYLANHGYPSDIVQDSWVVGYDPEYAIGLWLGYDELNHDYNLKQSVSIVERGNLFRAAGNAVFKKNNQEFKMPNSVVYSAVEKWTNNLLPSEDTPDEAITYEWFKKGTEPTVVSTKYIKLKNVTNLSVKYDPSTLSVNLSWTKASRAKDEKTSYGAFGYKIYKDDELLGFTSKTNYTVSDLEDPFGTYKVVTTYEDYDDMDSPGATYLLENKVAYTYDLLVPKSSNYTIAQDLDSWDLKPSSSDIKIYADGEETTDFTLTITIQNSKGDTVANISTTQEETFTITYTVTVGEDEDIIIKRSVIVA